MFNTLQVFFFTSLFLRCFSCGQSPAIFSCLSFLLKEVMPVVLNTYHTLQDDSYISAVFMPEGIWILLETMQMTFKCSANGSKCSIFLRFKIFNKKHLFIINILKKNNRNYLYGNIYTAAMKYISKFPMPYFYIEHPILQHLHCLHFICSLSFNYLTTLFHLY